VIQKRERINVVNREKKIAVEEKKCTRKRRVEERNKIFNLTTGRSRRRKTNAALEIPRRRFL